MDVIDIPVPVVVDPTVGSFVGVRSRVAEEARNRPIDARVNHRNSDDRAAFTMPRRGSVRIQAAGILAAHLGEGRLQEQVAEAVGADDGDSVVAALDIEPGT